MVSKLYVYYFDLMSNSYVFYYRRYVERELNKSIRMGPKEIINIDLNEENIIIDDVAKNYVIELRRIHGLNILLNE